MDHLTKDVHDLCHPYSQAKQLWTSIEIMSEPNNNLQLLTKLIWLMTQFFLSICQHQGPLMELLWNLLHGEAKCLIADGLFQYLSILKRAMIYPQVIVPYVFAFCDCHASSSFIISLLVNILFHCYGNIPHCIPARNASQSVRTEEMRCIIKTLNSI